MGLRRGSDVLAALLLASALALLASASTARAQDELERKNLERKVNESVASQSVNYTSVNITGVQYKASTKFNSKGMGQLYNVTNMFIDLIQPKQAYPDGMIRLVNGEPVFADPATEWRMILKHYGGLAGLGLTGLLLAALLPCVGLFFCCCRCAGRCGARSEPFDKKHDHCRKVVLSIFLICFATILCFGVVCAFVTNEQMQEGTRELPTAAKVSLGDVKVYLNTTRTQIDTLLKLNYKELERTLGNILHASGRIVTEQLTEDSHADSLMNLMVIVSGLKNIHKDLTTMKSSSQQLRIYAQDLGDCVRRVRNRIQENIRRCASQACNDFFHKNNISQMQVQVHFDKYMDRYFPKLPDQAVTQALEDISDLMAKNIVDDVRDGIEQFMNIQDEIQRAVNKTIPEVNSSIKKAGESIEKKANNIDQMIDRIIQEIDKRFIPQLDLAKRHIEKFSPYRYYLGLAISGVLLTVLACITFGLLCGICGKRPDGYGDDCCNKGSGARFLMMAVWIIFLLTSILMIITVVHMITGVLVERAICEPLKNSSDNRMFKLVDDFLNIKDKIYPNTPEANINMSHILSSCHKNETIYNVLKLQYVVDIDTLKGYVDSYDINQTIHELEERITISPDYKIISKEAKEKLKDLASSELSNIQFDVYAEELKQNITNVDLGQLADKLREFVNKLPSNPPEIRDYLLDDAKELDKCQSEIFSPMVNVSNHLSTSALELQEHIKFNHSSMPEAIHKLISEADEAQKFLTQNGPTHVKMLASEFGKAFINQVNKYLSHVINKILTEVGICGPMSNAYNATLVAGCNKILDPFNGFWASVGWCLILFIPTIVLCVKLSALYQKSDPYPGPLVEAEYLYDAYADRDNVPLAHIHDKKYVGHSRHHPGGGYPESYDGPASGYSDRERITDAHQSTSHHEARYTNLNPQEQSNVSNRVFALNQNNPQKIFTISNNSKNWEFPNGGPPRYQPAAVAPPLSTEYERPPPYYYPGPGDRN